MRILLTHPFCWPHVRRGTERFLKGLGQYLHDRQHEVTVLSSKPGAPVTVDQGGVTIRKQREIAIPGLRWVGLGPENLFLLSCLPFMLTHRFDVVLCLYPASACAARLAGWYTGTPYAMHLAGIPVAHFFRRRPIDNLLMRFALPGAAVVQVSTEKARECLESGFGCDPRVIPVPTDVSRFELNLRRDLSRPRILAVAAFSEPTKGAYVLAQAFVLLKERVPTAVLQYVGSVPPPLSRHLLAEVPSAVARDIQFLGVQTDQTLARLYRDAAVTVLPSLWEGFGLVLVESLACGTPVVGSRHGGIPDVVRPGVGMLFDPGKGRVPANAAGLAAALVDTLRMHEDPEMPRRCRHRAEELSWEAVGPAYERLLLEFAHRPATAVLG